MGTTEFANRRVFRLDGVVVGFRLLLGWFLYTTVGLSLGYQDVAPLFTKKCSGCHAGPYLDLRAFPFFSDRYPTRTELMEEMIRRTRLTSWQRMPPINYPPLEESEIALLEEWLRTGVEFRSCGENLSELK